MLDFTKRVLSVVRQIPVGRVATYGDIAALAKKPRAWRAVGTIMRNCQAPDIPCHRVVASKGRLGGYSDRFIKRSLLQTEGLRLTGDQLRNFEDVRWRGRR